MMYDGVNDVKITFPEEEFRKYVEKEKLLCWKYGESSLFGTNFYVYKKANSPGLTSDTQSLLGFCETHGLMNVTCLVQFWAAEVNTTVHDTNYRLTTTNHPFLLRAFPFFRPLHEGLCRYRTKTCDVIVPGDGRGGAIARVFQNKRIESTPDVAYYSSQEYPLRDAALSCHIKNSIVAPWFDSHGKSVGVIEFVSSWDLNDFANVLRFFHRYFSSSLGKRVDRCHGLCAQVRDGLFGKKNEDLFRSAMSEIKEVTGVVFKIPNIVIARTWILCNKCNFLSSCHETWGLYSGMHYLLKDVFTSCILQKGDGVVGKAAESSHNLVYCENVAKFSIIEYPLAHYARLYNISASFALCLRSSYTGDQVYILEFFLSRGVDLRTRLVPILDKMKRNFRTFKVAFGREELGDRLSVLVIDANSPDKLETLIGLETEDTSMGFSAPSVQSEFYVTIKAKYGEDRFIRFMLSASSGIHELYRQLSQRLELVGGTYDLKYLDEENDLIELTCDEDLQLYIRDSIKHEISTLTVLIMPK